MNILLIQLKRIGDLILTTPAIAAVREKFPSAEISLVVAAGTRELLPAIPGVDRTLIAKGRISSAAHWLTVARRKYQYCLDFTRNDRSAFRLVIVLVLPLALVRGSEEDRAGARARARLRR